MNKIIILLPLFLFFNSINAQEKNAQTGRQAPDFQLKTIEGDYIRLNDLLGDSPLLLSFWATWCKPCIEELAAYKKLYEDYKDNSFKILAISIDDESNVGKVKPLAKSRGYPFIILLDTNSEVALKYYALNVPYAVLLDKSGKIVFSHSGYVKGDEIFLRKEIDKLIGE
jgi:cytochrome c biogenesis protein CcmG, thiol:disulfide interchange protein DsbE